MKSEQREQVIKKATERRFKLLIDKGVEYAHYDPACIDADINWNFKEVAKRLGSKRAGTPVYSCGVYLMKSMISIEKWFQDGKLSSGESILSRLDDARNYLDIMESLMEEGEQEGKPFTPWGATSSYSVQTSEEIKKLIEDGLITMTYGGGMEPHAK